MLLRPGTRLQSTCCDTSVVVVRAPDRDVDVRCGGAPMVELDAPAERLAVDPEQAAGTLLGKRYAAADIELLCTRPGEGSLSLDGQPLPLKGAKPLPASD